MTRQDEPLHRLARLYGAYTAYEDATGRQREATAEALARVLRALGAPLDGPAGAADALREREQSLWRCPVAPVVVAWDGGPAEVPVRLPARLADVECQVALRLETGEERRWPQDLGRLAVREKADVAGTSYVAKAVPLPGSLPPGYHDLAVELSDQVLGALLLAAPVRAYRPGEGAAGKTWGVAAPLYAIHSARSWGAGDFADLERLIDDVRRRGGGLVATLPLLAAFLDEPFEPGPYAPASRLFWNEFFLDVDRVPELARCPPAQALLASPAFRAEVEALRAAPLVDYRAQMALKRRVLEELARAFFSGPSERRAAFERHLADDPCLEDYARFRAATERHRTSWHGWPARQRGGDLRAGDFDDEARRYHLYVQWLAREQLHGLAAKARAGGPGLYLDLPLGVHPDSYDVWRERPVFAQGMAAGAPPDAFFPGGQNWGFPPQHPERMREQGYRYLRACLGHHMQFGGLLRIDHLMGLHRLYWVPDGFGARDGVYVRYPAEELYAVFTLESHRHRAVLVGEDLGTVPPEVPTALARHGIDRTYVVQYELGPEPEAALPPVFAGCVAGVNTHDMPPFGCFWRGLDIDDRVDLGILEASASATEHQNRRDKLNALVRFLRQKGLLPRKGRPGAAAVLGACMDYLGAGPARVVLMNLEDLWLETQPQNVPGTWRERPNWRRKARYPLEALDQVPGAAALLERIDRSVKET